MTYLWAPRLQFWCRWCLLMPKLWIVSSVCCSIGAFDLLFACPKCRQLWDGSYLAKVGLTLMVLEKLTVLGLERGSSLEHRMEGWLLQLLYRWSIKKLIMLSCWPHGTPYLGPIGNLGRLRCGWRVTQKELLICSIASLTLLMTQFLMIAEFFSTVCTASQYPTFIEKVILGQWRTEDVSPTVILLGRTGSQKSFYCWLREIWAHRKWGCNLSL